MYVFNFQSSWFIVFFSIERFIVVYYPFSKYKLINNRNKAYLITFLFVLSLSVYAFVPITIGLEYIDEVNVCIWIRWIDQVERFILIETLVTIFIPFIIILLINMLISVKLFKDLLSLRKIPFNLDHQRMNINMREEFPMYSDTYRINLNQISVTRRKREYTKTTRNLIFILTIFLVLNTPLVYSNICILLINSIQITRLDQVVFHFSRDLFYLNFSINFFLYAFDRSQFSARNLFGCCLK